MTTQRRAVIDIGTNSVKLLVADVSDRTVVPLLEQSAQTRLGEGFYETHTLQPWAIQRTANAVQTLFNQATELKPESIRVIATSAARDAINQSELLQAVESASGLKVEIISGEQEAEWAFTGVVSDPGLANLPVLILDVGGGSTEFIIGDAGVLLLRRSFRLGTVRLMEQLRLSDPPTQDQWAGCTARLHEQFASEIIPALQPALSSLAPRSVRLIGTGGTTTILARMKLVTNAFDREQLESVRLTKEGIDQQRERLWNLPLADRKKITGLPPNRADVILLGVAIFAVLMDQFGFSELRISTRGLRFAAVLTTA